MSIVCLPKPISPTNVEHNQTKVTIFPYGLQPIKYVFSRKCKASDVFGPGS